MGQSPGIYILRASRVERLALSLQSHMRAHRADPDAPLVPHTVIVANAGLRSWLPLEIARQRGSDNAAGIVADLKTVLPSTYFQSLARAMLRNAVKDSDQYEQGPLRWAIYTALDSVQDASLSAYLSPNLRAADRALRKLELASRLAQLFGEYMIYRPDWLQDWRRSPATGSAGLVTVNGQPVEPSFVPEIWRRVTATRPGPDRGRVLAALSSALATAAPPPLFDESPDTPLHVFGLQHMPLAELSVLSGISKYRSVRLYVPDPANTHWTGLADLDHDYRRALQDSASSTELQALEDELQNYGHPLISSWARLGQHFFMRLESLDTVDDARDVLDAETDLEPAAGRLGAVQESIRQPRLELLRDHVHQAADASLRIHDSYTRLRELQALRDALWSAFQDIDDLTPAQILVVAPRMDAYLPYLPAVFGPAGEVRPGHLPYHVRQVAAHSTDSLFTAIEQLLRLIGSRVGLSGLMAVFTSSALQTQFGLDAVTVRDMADTLQANQVAWGLDPDDIDRPTHSMQWGVDRMVATYLMGGQGSDIESAQVWQGAQGPVMSAVSWDTGAADFPWLGALNTVLERLQDWRRRSRGEMTVAGWLDAVGGLVTELFGAAPSGDLEHALHTWRRLLDELKVEHGDVAERVPFAVARQLVLTKLSSVDEQQPYLFGGVTFANLAAQRAIPYRFIAVLGLNDGEFPRQSSDQGLDLMRKHPRIGDRPYRVDDRYAFLETVMAARDRLHLSYVGRSERDGKVLNPSLVLQDLMVQLGGVDKDGKAPWLIQHPLLSTDSLWDPLPVSGAVAPPPARSGAAFDTESPLAQVLERGAAESPPLLRVEDLRRYYRRPFDALARDGADARADEPIEIAELDSEPLDPQFAALDTMDSRVLWGLAAGADYRLGTPPTWLRAAGKLPVGELAVAAWDATLADAQAAYVHLQDILGTHPVQTQTVSVRVDLTDRQLAGRVQGVRTTPDADWVVRYRTASNKDKDKDNDNDNDKVKDDKGGKGSKKDNSLLFSGGRFRFDHLIPLFIDWACLRLNTPADRAVRLLALTSRGAHEFNRPWDDWATRFAAAPAGGRERAEMLDDLRQRLEQLVDYWRGNLSQPRFYAPTTSSQFFIVPPHKKPNPAANWLGGYSKGERDYSIYSRLFDADGLFGDTEQDNRDVIEQMKQDAAFLMSMISGPQPTPESTNDD